MFVSTRSLALFVMVCITPLAKPAFAYRPFITEDAGVAGLKTLQTEVSFDSYQWKNGDVDQTFLLVAPIYGPTENIELSTELPYVTHIVANGSTTKGVGDINLVAKYVVAWERFETKDALFTIKGYVKLNSGSYAQGLGRGDTEYVLSPVFTKIVNTSVTVHAQYAYSWVVGKQDPDLRNFRLWGLAADYRITEPFHLIVEFTSNQNPERGQVDQKLSQLGFTYAVNKDLIFDTSYKKGIGLTSPTRGFGVGVSIQF